MFRKLVQPQTRNSLAIDMQSSFRDEDDDDYDDILDEDESDIEGPVVQIDRNILLALAQRLPGQPIPPRATSLSHCTRDGINYSVKRVHEGNSNVLCKDSETPYSIEQILVFPKEATGVRGIWLAVRRHKRAAVQRDPYRRYPLLRAHLRSPELESTIELLNLSEIEAHFAKCLIQWEEQEVAVVVSLSRVRLLFVSVFSRLIRTAQSMRLLSQP